MSQPAGGSEVSHYQLIRKLGSGGMGDVYLADDRQLGRQVAIKFLNLPGDERARHRLLNEARAAAALDHPLICAVYEVGHDDTRGDFIVMQYVEGETLAWQLARGPLGLDATLALANDVAEGLAAAHRQGIIHRDLKPHNIMVQPSGRAKLLDFGISKRLTSSRQAAEAATETQLTGSNAIVGTHGYMSPEQVKGQPADARSDLFALGCVLHECLTGQRAFPGATPAEAIGQVLHTEPPAVSTTVSVPPEIDALISRLIRKVPAERFQSADELVGAIRTLRGLTPLDVPTRPMRSATGPVSVKRPRRFVAIGAAAIVAAIAVSVWWQGRALPEPTAEAKRWYDAGVEALRDGAYVSARTALNEAVQIFPSYPQAYSRLAEACVELDDENAAQAALLRAMALAPDRRLPADERLRVEAVRATVLREYDAAIKAYTALTAKRPKDAGLRVDAGRAQEAAGNIGAAREHYAKAVEIDPHYAAARLRLGYAEAQSGSSTRAIAEYDEAIRLYAAASRVEGEAEALVRKGGRQTATGDLIGARASLERAIAITADERYMQQRTRAMFQLGRVTLAEGRSDEAEKLATEAVAKAEAAGLERDAAEGLIDLSNALAARKRNIDANAALERSIALAVKKSAKRTEMRGRMQMASLRLATGDFGEAVKLSEVPLKFAVDGRYRGLEAQTRNVISRAREYLEEYDEARKMATEVLKYAESVENQALISESLESLAGQLTRLGRLPEALRYRERIEQINRRQGAHGALKFDLPNRADLLIRLGRGKDALSVLDEVRAAMASGNPAYADRGRRIALYTALLASTAGRFADVEGPAREAIGPPSDKPDGTALFALVLREHALARLGRSRELPAKIAAGLAQVSSAVIRRDLSYWVADTLLLRKDPTLALSVVAAELASPVLKDNVELRWRLNALADRAVRAGAMPAQAVNYKALADDDARRLIADWAGDATAYFARTDLAVLRQSR